MPDDTPSLSDFYTPTEEAVGVKTTQELQFFSQRNAYLWTVPADSTSPNYKDNVPVAEETLKTADKSLAESVYTDAAARAHTQVTSNFVENAQADTLGSMDFVAARYKRLGEERAVIEAAPEAAVSVATVGALREYQDVNEVVQDNAILQDMVTGSIAKQMEDTSLPSKILDFGITAVVTPRALAGQMQFAQSVNPEAYFNLLKEWRTKSSKEKIALWPAMNAQLVEAAGNNSFVYLAIATPFQNKDDEIWARMDQGAGILSLVAGLFSAYKISNAIRGQGRMVKFSELAKNAGNLSAAGKATDASLRKGGQEAIEAAVEGHPIKVPEGDIYHPELVQGVSVPVQRIGMSDLADEIKLSGVPEENKNARIAIVTSRLATEGNVLEVRKDYAGFEVVLEKPATESVPLATIAKDRAALNKEIKQLRADLKAELADTPTGAENPKLESITSRLRWLKLQENELKQKVAIGRGVSKASGVPTKGVKVKMPTTTKETVRFNWTVDDVTGELKFAENGPNTLQYLLLSKESTIDKVDDTIKTFDGTMADQQQRKVYSDYARQIQQVRRWLQVNPLLGNLFTKRSTGRVESVLLRGEQEGRIIPTSELVSGVKTPNGIVNLSAKEVEAYHGSRVVFDNLWVGLNKAQRDQLQFAGFSAFDANYVNKAGETVRTTLFARARPEDIGYAIPKSGTSDSIMVMDAITGHPIDLRSLPTLADDLAKRRKGFVELRDGFHTADGKQYRHMLVDVDTIGDLKRVKQAKGIPSAVLPYRTGYVPKIVTNPIHHLVQMSDEVSVNGVKVRSVRNLGGFSSAKEAQVFINRKQAEWLAKGGTDPTNSPARLMEPVPVDAAFKVNAENAEAMDLIHNSLFKGAFGGHRTDGEFKIGLDQVEATRMGAFEAMQRYADYVGRHLPMHQFRETKIRQFLNSTKDMRAVENDWSSDFTAAAKHDARYFGAKSMQDWMRSTFAIPTSEEHSWGRFAELLANSLDRVIYKDDLGSLSVGSTFLKRTQMGLLNSKWANDPVQAAKGFAFDMYLGMFNPIQLVVQTAGMAIPMSLHPVEGAAALPKFLALRTLFRMDPKDAGVAAKAMGLNGKEFENLVYAFNKSGMPDSILAHSDFGHFATSKFGYYSPSMWEEIKKSGRIFYNMGELNNKTFAWLLANERLAKANGWVRTARRTNEEITQITEEAYRLGMNMTQANRTKSQTLPILSLMTQFWKVTTQFYENALSGLIRGGKGKGGAWTRTESAAALINSTLLLGAANFSLDELAPQLEQWVADTFDIDVNTPEGAATMKTYRDGPLGLVTSMMFGYDIDLSDRIGVASGVNMIHETIRNLVTSVVPGGETGDFFKAVLGASRGVQTRFFTALADTMEVFGVAGEQKVLNKEMAEVIIKSWARVTSTGNNALNALLWRNANQIIVAGTGERLGELPDSNAWIGKALGVDPLNIEKYYIVDKKSRAYDKLKADASKEVAKLARELYMQGGIEDAAMRELYRQRMHMVVSSLDEADKEAVIGGALAVLDEDPKTERMEVKMIEKLLESRTKEEADTSRWAIDTLKGTQ
jgi:hypothetical protein